MRVVVTPSRIVARAGQASVVTVDVTNTGEVISGHVVRVLGVDEAWVALGTPQLSLFPGTSGSATLVLTPPDGLAAGTRQLAVQVRELTPPYRTDVVPLELVVPAEVRSTARLEPAVLTTGTTGSCTVVVENTGNTILNGPLVGSDEEGRLRFAFLPAVVDLAPGERTTVEARVRGRRPLTGSPALRPFAVRLDADLPAASATGMPTAPPILPDLRGTMVQRPLLSRGALTLVGLLAAISVFALVITAGLGRVVDQSAADRQLALQVAQIRDADGAAGTGALAGTVRLLTDSTGIGGVTVDVFDGDGTEPLTSLATDDEGAYRLRGLDEGAYVLRFRGAGFAELWYPQALARADATPVELQSGQRRAGLDVRLGGLPARLSGTVVVAGGDASGATVALQLPGSVLPDAGTEAGVAGSGQEAGAVLATSAVDADGRFVLSGIPSPKVYDLIVTRSGFAREVQRLDLGGGEDRRGVQVRLRKGDGTIRGTVNDLTGPVSEATVTATTGQTTVQTISLTEGAEAGQFTLRGLPTPATYTVVVAKAGRATQTLILSLTAGQQLSGVAVTMREESGTLGGLARLADGTPAGGVSVRVTNGDLTVQTVTRTVDPRDPDAVGRWQVTGLPVPSTYTVTFSRPDLADQTASVDLDALGLQSDLTVDARLRSATASVLGRATDGSATGPGLGEVEVVLSSGATTYRVRTASVPAEDLGRFRLDKVVPGTYTLSLVRKGARPSSRSITLVAGQEVRADAALAASAGITGLVMGPNGPLSGAEVALFRSDQYPDTRQAVTRTDARGRYVFNDLDAPQGYVVEVSFPAGSQPQASTTVTTRASTTVEASTMTVKGDGQ